MQNMNVSLMEENAIRIKSGITIYVSVIVKIRKTCVQKRLYPATCGCENGKYLASVIDNSVVMCDEIIEKTKTVPTSSTSTYFYILLTFLLITIALLIIVSIHLIKHRSKQKHLLPYTTQITN